MADHSTSLDDALDRLRARVKGSIAFEEALVTTLCELRHEHQLTMGESETRMLNELIRRHRVGLIKRRAILGALNIHV